MRRIRHRLSSVSGLLDQNQQQHTRNGDTQMSKSEGCPCGSLHVIAVYAPNADEYDSPEEVHAFADCVSANQWVREFDRKDNAGRVLEGASATRDEPRN